MRKRNIILVVLLAIFVIVLAVSTSMAVKRSSKAQKYNLGCVTTATQDPLNECKE